MEPLLFVEIFVSTVIGRFRSKMHYEKKDIDCTRDPFQSSQLEYHSSPGQEKMENLKNLGMDRYLLLGRVYKKVGIISKNGRNYRGKKGLI